MTATDPHSVGGYRVLSRLGCGGMGVVYLALTRHGERRVALKLMRRELADQPRFRARFAHEVAAARAVRGSFTERVLDADLTARPPWIVTDYIPGPTLGEYLRCHGPMRQPQVRLLGLGLGAALQSIHAAGLIHRDLKPGNILLARQGPKVIDFGIARAEAAGGLGGNASSVGSLSWMSPEQLTGLPVSPAADVFALGLVLAEASTGRHPFGNGAAETIALRIIYQEADLRDVPDSLRGLIAGMLAKAAAGRPTLSGCLDGLGVPGSTDRPGSTADRVDWVSGGRTALTDPGPPAAPSHTQPMRPSPDHLRTLR